MNALTIGILSSVIASTIMLLIERRIFPKKEKENQPPQIIYQDHRGNPVYRNTTPQAPQIPRWLSLTFAVCLPPLAVYLEKGAQRALWINIGLTLLWLWPGIFHALMVVLAARTQQP